MNLFAHALLIGWLPLALLAFAALPVRVAILAVTVAGTLFLPVMTITLPGSPDYSKDPAIAVSLVLGTLLYGRHAAARFRPSVHDLPIVCWLLSGPIASLANDHSTYDAMANLLDGLTTWGIPYIVGRCFFTAREHGQMLLWAIFLGGLVYAPFCAWEIRMSPTLHARFFGQPQVDFIYTWRGEGYRPMVFMSHGLELSLWMANATIAGFGLWRLLGHRHLPGALRLPKVPMAWLCTGLALIVVLCKSTGATMLLAGGLLMLVRKLALVRLFVIAFIPLYLAARVSNTTVVEELMADAVRPLTSARALSSMTDRFEMEHILIQRAWERPVFGWTAWDFNEVSVEEDTVAITTDSRWIITFTTAGFLGLIGYALLFWWPATRALLAVGAAGWRQHRDLIAHAVVLLLLLSDTLFNAWVAPFYALLAGSLTNLVARSPAAATVAAPAATTASDDGTVPSPRLTARSSGPATALTPRSAAGPDTASATTRMLLPRQGKER